MSAATEASDALATLDTARTARNTAAAALIAIRNTAVSIAGCDDVKLQSNVAMTSTAEEDAYAALLTKLAAVDVALPE